MSLREYRLSEPPSWPLRALGLAILGVAATTWTVIPTTVQGLTAPLVPALVLEALFFGAVGAALWTTAAELQDGVIAVVALGALAVGLYVPTHLLVGGDLTHPVARVLLSLTVGVAVGLVAAVPGFAVHFFGEDADRLGAPE